ncbi:MAG: hypothetical protein DSZ06_04730 [Sulfurospirillum sp.]|nr:MAG: hypothetical protein DSZ06_04730 [Sulfurospirillum sp.]
MKILIVENEIYLSQSISNKLGEMGHVCESAATVKDAMKLNTYDAVLLSTNLAGQNIYPLIEKYKNAIIILMVSYISNDTVTKPLQAGADDYILKPFMIEELTRKLNHLHDYISYKKENETYKSYIEHVLKKDSSHTITNNTKFPLLLKVNYQKVADAIVFEYAKNFNESFVFISLEDNDALEQISKISDDELIYIINFQNIKNSQKTKVLAAIENKRAILSTTDLSESIESMEVMEVKNDEGVFEKGEILSIENYVKYIITKYQSKFPDTELSKKLGISRKSLWEKRKRYGISKKK